MRVIVRCAWVLVNAIFTDGVEIRVLFGKLADEGRSRDVTEWRGRAMSTSRCDASAPSYIKSSRLTGARCVH